MDRLGMYTDYVIKDQLLLKYPKMQIKNLPYIKKIIFYVYFRNLLSEYNLYLYNLCILVFLISGQKFFTDKCIKSYSSVDVSLKLIINKKESYIFIDCFNKLLLPLFSQYNMPLNIKDIDILGGFNYQLNYADPIFTSKNIVTNWSTVNKLNIHYLLNTRDRNLIFVFLQYLKFKWSEI